MTNPVIPHAPCRGIFQLCRKPLQLAQADEAVPKILGWFSPTIAARFVPYNMASDYGKLCAQHGLEVTLMLELATQLAWAIHMCKLRSCTVDLFNLDRIWWGCFQKI